MAKSKPSLLNTLKSAEKNLASVNSEFIQQIPLDKLIENPLNQFSMEEDEAFERSLHSIEQDGFFEDLIVTPIADGTYRIISGHRRAAIARKLGKVEVPCKVRTYASELEEIRALIGANIHKRTIRPMDMARQLRVLSEVLDRENEFSSMRKRLPQLAEQTGLSVRTVERYLDLLQLNPTLVEWLNAGILNLGDAYELGQKKNIPLQDVIVSQVMQMDESIPLADRVNSAIAIVKKSLEEVISEREQTTFDPSTSGTSKIHAACDPYKTVNKYRKTAKKMISEFVTIAETPVEKTDELSQTLDEFETELEQLLSACKQFRSQWDA